MTEYEDRPIMVGVDGSAESLEAARWAAAEARLHACPMRVVCVYSWPAPQMPLAPLPADWTEQSLRSAAEDVVAAAVDVVRAEAPDLGVTGSALPGLAASKLVELSRMMGMVVVGHRGHGGFAALRLGSVAAKVAAHAHGPVTVVRPGTGDRLGREDTILVGVDGSPASDAALGYALEEAERRGATVQALHSWEAPGPPWRTGMLSNQGYVAKVRAAEEHRVAGWLKPWLDKHPHVLVHQRLTGARPAAALIEAAQDTALLVVGSRGHDGFAGLLLGSVSQQVIHHAPCPVVVVR